MATYTQWNDALIEYFTFGAPVGSTIYLNVNDRTLDQVGAQFWESTEHATWADDYLAAIREEMVDEGCVFLGSVVGTSKRRPKGVAFLGVLVLVASRMDQDLDQSISERDYFTRLNDALHTEPAGTHIRRPKHMTVGADGEEPIWKAWAKYLRSRGYLPTASAGKGSWKYIGYPISQTLLREPEKRRLFQVFAARGWGREPDPELLTSLLRHEEGLPTHLRALLARSGQALEDVQFALGEAYREWEEREVIGAGGVASGALSRHLQAGLYRLADWRTGEARYALFPRQPRGLRLLDLEVALPEGAVSLQIERPGYYAPVGEVSGAALASGIQAPLSGHPQLDVLDLPPRPFWLLRTDPDNPEAQASLGRPAVGEHFLLLAQNGLRQDLMAYREQGLMQWGAEHTWEGGWTEYHGVMVMANHWDVAAVSSRELLDALRPASGVSVSFTGGLRVPKVGGWLDSAPPTVVVHSFFAEPHLSICHGEATVFDGAIEPNVPVAVPWCGPGDYEFSVEARGQGQVRLMKLLDWSDLPGPGPSSLDQQGARWTGAEGQAWVLSGARLRPEVRA